MMTSKERVFGAVGGTSVDRRPFAATLSLYGAKLTGCPLRQYYSDASAYARGQAAVLETFQPDILFSPFALVALAEAFGGEAVYFDDRPPNLRHPAISSVEDLPQLTVPGVDSNPRILYTRQGVQEMAAAHGDETVIAGILLSPIDLPLMIMGIDAWMQTVLFDESGTKRMLDLTVPFFSAYADALVADGADVLIMPAAFLSPAVVTRKIVETVALPILREALSGVKCPTVIHHVGGPFLAFLDLFTDLPNVVGFILDHRDDLGAAREKTGSGVTLLQGPDGPNMGKETPEEVERQCDAILKDRRGDPYFILATTCADVAYDTPPENIHAMRRAVENAPETGYA